MKFYVLICSQETSVVAHLVSAQKRHFPQCLMLSNLIRHFSSLVVSVSRLEVNPPARTIPLAVITAVHYCHKTDV